MLSIIKCKGLLLGRIRLFLFYFFLILLVEVIKGKLVGVEVLF